MNISIQLSNNGGKFIYTVDGILAWNLLGATSILKAKHFLALLSLNQHLTVEFNACIIPGKTFVVVIYMSLCSGKHFILQAPIQSAILICSTDSELQYLQLNEII